MLAPLRGNMFGSGVRTVHFHSMEIQQLEIQVIVGQSTLGIQTRVPGQIHDLHTALHGSTQSTANILA